MMILMKISIKRMREWMTEKTNLGRDANPVLNYCG
jgi:hypothetical protein